MKMKSRNTQAEQPKSCFIYQASENGGKRAMWKWLEENHPIINEAIWWGVNAISLTAIIISTICICSK